MTPMFITFNQCYTNQTDWLNKHKKITVTIHLIADDKENEADIS